MDLDHPDLEPNLYPREDEDWNFASETSSIPEDHDGHGTSCAGIAAAAGDNGTGIIGVCPDCRIMPLEVDLSAGLIQDRADAIQYAVAFQQAHPELRLILSNSWRLTTGSSAAIEAAFAAAHAAGIPSLCASGNDNGPVVYPARYATTIAVGATTQCDERKSPTTCDGNNSWGSNVGNELDVVAPGVKITTTRIAGYRSTFAGTSAACPIAAGTVGLMLSRNRWLTPADVRTLLADSAADEVGTPGEDPPGHDIWMGSGRIDAYGALLATPEPQPPIVSSVTPAEGYVHVQTEVVIQGSNFHGNIAVDFDGVPAVSVTPVDPSTVIAVAPRGVDLLPTDINVHADLGSAVLPEAYLYRPLLTNLNDPHIGEALDFFTLGLPHANYGVVVDYHPGPTEKKGLIWDIGFVEAEVTHNSFHTSDLPMNGFGQGRTDYIVPNDPGLIGRTIYAQAAVDGNGNDTGRPITLSNATEATILP